MAKNNAWEVIMLAVWLLLLGMGVSMKAIEQITLEELKERAKKVEIVFNNHPDDTSIILNGGVAEITPGRVNITIKGATDVTLKKAAQDLALRVWLIGELEKIKSITINKVAGADNEYEIIPQPGSLSERVKAKDPQQTTMEALLGIPN